ncbi:hypothetical protein [Virgibacillus subterraneus]|uniref:hypothetical protein n=1 Tax=Virgibacillus subterraneus TaxID=621109 RepID=UPI00111358A1|nr:hypothetical protein [Virgibacillus subterraneus]
MFKKIEQNDIKLEVILYRNQLPRLTFPEDKKNEQEVIEKYMALTEESNGGIWYIIWLILPVTRNLY